MQHYSDLGPAHDAVRTLFNKVHQAQTRDHLFANPVGEQPLTVVVGVSGGADSVCLLHLLAQLAATWRLTLHVAHLDHNLRPESAADAAFVRQLAATLQLPFHIARLPAGALTHQPGGLEAAARCARYAFLLRTTINVTPVDQVPCLVLAHHADDQAETVLLNLVRGSGLQGVSGMHWRSTMALNAFVDEAALADSPPALPLVQVVRPFLNVRRSEILAYLQVQQLAWREDASNQDPTFLRNQFRHELLPRLAQMNPNVVETLGRTAQILAGEAERLQRLDRQTLAGLCLEPVFSTERTTEVVTTKERVVLDVEKLLALALADQRGVLRQALALLQPGLPEIGFEPIESLLWQLRSHPHAGGPHPLLHDLQWSVAGATPQSRARLSLHRADVLPFPSDYPYLDEPWRHAIGALTLPNQGQVTTPGGWTLQMEAMSVTKLPPNWQRRDQPWQVYLDTEQADTLVLTTPRPGLQFAPLGLNGRHKALGDFFTDRKVPVSLRAGWPLLIDQATETVLWVCGLAPGHAARITQATQKLLCLRWIRT
ncbi:MAG: tRNA lysidine(34) synthetase TilS [Caldilineaceae bacterium]